MRVRTYDIVNAGPRNRFMANGRIVSNSSRGAQLQNLLRMSILKKPAKLAAAIKDVRAGMPPGVVGVMHGPPIVIAGELLRPTLIAAPDCWMARGDSKQIEARVTPWLAGAHWKLDAFQRYDEGRGPDLYKIAAAGIHGISPEDIDDGDPRRQTGKVSELALGFAGGPAALQAMARGYSLQIPAWVEPLYDPDRETRPEPTEGTDRWVVNRWRAANPEMADPVTGVWARMNDAALGCVMGPAGAVVPTGIPGVTFRRNAAALAMTLPGGGRIVYWTPRVIQKRTPWGAMRPAVQFRAEDALTSQWTQFDGYGGLFFQNLVQRVARDLMAYWLRALAALPECWPILLVHDEAVAEMRRSRYPMPEDCVAAVLAVMRTKPAWAAGLPVNADASAGVQYVK